MFMSVWPFKREVGFQSTDVASNNFWCEGDIESSGNSSTRTSTSAHGQQTATVMRPPVHLAQPHAVSFQNPGNEAAGGGLGSLALFKHPSLPAGWKLPHGHHSSDDTIPKAASSQTQAEQAPLQVYCTRNVSVKHVAGRQTPVCNLPAAQQGNCEPCFDPHATGMHGPDRHSPSTKQASDAHAAIHIVVCHQSPANPMETVCLSLPPSPANNSKSLSSPMQAMSWKADTVGRRDAQPTYVQPACIQPAVVHPGFGFEPCNRPHNMLEEAQHQDLELVQEIGQGGFGKVYYGHWRGSPVAIKVATLRPHDAERQLQEFRREVTSMSSIPAHPNILRLLAACLDPQHLTLVTEFCPNGCLYTRLHAPGALPLQSHELLRIWLGVARGMQHLHACKVLHRDLKSANLLLDGQGSVKIGDFGLSRLGPADVAMTGGLGTYQWMAPEVLTSQRYSEKADVYSFGMVMWECLTHKVPFEGLTAVQAGLQVAIQGLRPEIPRGTDVDHAQLIQDCWAPVPDQRPSFADIVSKLEVMMGMHAL